MVRMEWQGVQVPFRRTLLWQKLQRRDELAVEHLKHCEFPKAYPWQRLQDDESGADVHFIQVLLVLSR